MEQVRLPAGASTSSMPGLHDTDTGSPVGNLKINGAVMASAGWNGWGLPGTRA